MNAPSRWPTWLQRLHEVSCRYELVLGVVLFNILLRIPNLSEPYWYGDEAIYLTIGTALRHGGVLYQTIVDHKTPLIYYLAMVPSQFWFRVLLLVWSSLFTALFYGIARYWLRPRWAFVTALLFAGLTAFPGLEGNIPNGELFVIGFMVPALWLMHQTQWLQRFLPLAPQEASTAKYRLTSREVGLFAGAGFLAGLGVLTKVPALLDVAALDWLIVLLTVQRFRIARTTRWMGVRIGLLLAALFGIAVLTPLVLSILYFTLRGAFADYLQFGLLYNFHYTGTWSLPFDQPWLVTLFGLPAKVAILAGFVLISGVISWFQPKRRPYHWLGVWLVATLVASSLSNRPYPHYLIQILPPLMLLVGTFLSQSWAQHIVNTVSLALTVALITLLQFGMYPTWKYYTQYFKFATGQISPAEYRHHFNGLVAQNEQLVPRIQAETQPSDPIFLWGTNPMLYAQAQRAPVSTFTVAFHVHDLQRYDQTLQEVKEQPPRFIVIMKDEAPLPGLDAFLHEWYMLTDETDSMRLYRHTSLARSNLIQ